MPRKGQKISEEHKKIIRLARKGKHNSPATEFKKGYIMSEIHKANIAKAMQGKTNPFYGKVHSEITKKKLSEKASLRIGNKANHWKGGITPLNIKIRNSIRNVGYKIWKKHIWNFNEHFCKWCKNTNNLHADHIKPFAWFSKLRHDTNNGQLLCADCHHWKSIMDFKIFKGKIPELNIV